MHVIVPFAAEMYVFPKAIQPICRHLVYVDISHIELAFVGLSAIDFAKQLRHIAFNMRFERLVIYAIAELKLHLS